MSIPAQGRRGVLFPPPGVKIRRTIETMFLPNAPMMIAEHDPKRVLLTVMEDVNISTTVIYAGSLVGLATQVAQGNGYPGQRYFYGPEEVWAECIYPTASGGSNILVQSVFYD